MPMWLLKSQEQDDGAEWVQDCARPWARVVPTGVSPIEMPPGAFGKIRERRVRPES